MSNTEWLDLCDSIDDGDFDDGLEHIMKALVSRRGVINERNARRLIRTLTKGARVMLTNGIAPRYFEGMVGTVRAVRNEGAVIDLDDLPSGRGRPPTEGHQKRIMVPFVHIVLLDDRDVRATKVTKPDPAEVGDDNDYEGDDEDDDDDDD